MDAGAAQKNQGTINRARQQHKHITRALESGDRHSEACWRIDVLVSATLATKGCGNQRSVTARTISQDTRKPLTVWIRAMWWVTRKKNGATAWGLWRVLGLGSYDGREARGAPTAACFPLLVTRFSLLVLYPARLR
jgi:hypothetical protein